MIIEINDEIIKSQVEKAAAELVAQAIRGSTSGYDFNVSVRNAVRTELASAVAKEITAQLDNYEEIRKTVKDEVVKRITRELNKAIKTA
jgi:K+-transporting ATPase c subunit